MVRNLPSENYLDLYHKGKNEKQMKRQSEGKSKN